MKIDLNEMSDDELLELSKNIVALRAERELKDMPKYAFERDEDLLKLANVWFGSEISDAAKGDLIYTFLNPALYKITDYITGNCAFKYKRDKLNESQRYPFSTNNVKAEKVKRYREVHDALVNCLIELSRKEKSDEN